MDEREQIVSLFTEVTDTIRSVGMERFREALFRARLNGTVTTREIDLMSYVCEEFGVTTHQLLNSRDKSHQRKYATAVYVYIMVRKYEKPVTDISKLMSLSRTHIYRLIRSIEKLNRRHKSTAWVVTKLEKLDNLTDKLKYAAPPIQ